MNTIRFWSNIAYLYPYVTKYMINLGYIYGIDLWGYKPKHDASHLEFKTYEIKEVAAKYLRTLTNERFDSWRENENS